jgi:predicted lipoprotein with Yx(FWY)xxD motif
MRARMSLIATPLLAMALALVACGNDAGRPRDGAASQAGNAKTVIKVADSDFGRMLVDESGRTLYAFTKDKDRASNCDEKCIAVWPALTIATSVTAGDGANASMIGQAKQGDRVQQATYGEWPLYYYVGDAVAGDVNGQGIDDEWFVLSPDGKLIKATD